MLKELSLKSRQRVEMLNITDKVAQYVQEAGLQNGLVTIYVPHTTAGVTINESADPDVQGDIIKELNKLIPFEDHYAHMEGNSAAHIKTSLFGSSETVIVQEGKLLLGRWQAIYFCEFDGPRFRKVYLKALKA